MQLPIAADVLKLEVTSEPRAVIDFETKTPKLDEKGRPLYAVRCLWDYGRSTEMITIKVPGPLPTFGHRVAVRATDLYATPWVNNGKDGISFSAESLVALSGSANKAA